MCKFHSVAYLKNNENENEKDFNSSFFLSDFPAFEMYVLPFPNTVCSFFIGLVNKKNNLDQISRVYLQVKFRFKRCLRQFEGG